MDANDVQNLERHVSRDIALVTAGALVGIAIGEMLGFGPNIAGAALLIVGVALLVAAVWMKR